MLSFLAAAIVITLLLLLPLQWITLTQLAGFAIRLPYPALLAALALAVLFRPFRAGTLRMARASRLWAMAFLLYLLIAFLALYGGPGQGSPVRQVFFVLGTLALGGCILTLPDPRPVLRYAGLACLMGFVIVTEVIGRQIGIGWLDAAAAFLGGDLDFVIYGFLRNIYNFFGEDSELMVVASEKNAISASLLVGLVLFRAAGPRYRSDWAGMAATVFALGLLVVLNTRSVLLPMAIMLMLAPLLRLIRAPGRDPSVLILWLTAWGVILGVVVALLMVDSPLRDLLGGRFSLGDSSSTSRVTQQIAAMRQIEGAILTGNGYTLVDGNAVHNLFLGAFVQAGLAAFLLVLAFYLVLALTCLRFIWRLAQGADFKRLNLRPEWVAVLPLLPLVRVWLTGDFGHPGIAEWAAIGCFFALLSYERRGLPSGSAYAHVKVAHPFFQTQPIQTADQVAPQA